jgi:hypothetical protein
MAETETLVDADSEHERKMSVTFVHRIFVKHSFDNQVTTQSHPRPRSATPIFSGARTDDLKDLTVAKVIEFYIPTKFAKPVKWMPSQLRGKVIEFCLPTKKSA